jgi:hypothetical protein
MRGLCMYDPPMLVGANNWIGGRIALLGRAFFSLLLVEPCKRETTTTSWHLRDDGCNVKLSGTHEIVVVEGRALGGWDLQLLGTGPTRPGQQVESGARIAHDCDLTVETCRSI